MDKYINWIKFVGGIAISAAGYLFGCIDLLFTCLLMLTIIDYISGVVAAVYSKTLSSSTGFKGILRKIGIFIAISVAVILERVTGIDGIRTLTVSFYIANEGISVMENLGKIGIPLPEKLKSVLSQLKTTADKQL